MIRIACGSQQGFPERGTGEEERVGAGVVVVELGCAGRKRCSDSKPRRESKTTMHSFILKKKNTKNISLPSS